MIPIQFPAALLLLLANLVAIAGAQSENTRSPERDLLGNPSAWRTVLDGVMGGRSTGYVRTADDAPLAFEGELSLENNGGFSSMRRAVEGTPLAGARGLVIECRGDGRAYNFDLRSTNFRRMGAGYRRQFETTAGRWTEVRLPFDEFRLQSFGRFIRNATALDPAKVESMGITLSDKRAGKFRLQIRSIRTFGPGDPASTAAAITPAGSSDVLKAAKSAGLTTLITCVQAAGVSLPQTPVTVFAPTNSAFAKLPKAEIERLLEPANRTALRRLLALHVVPGRIDSSALLPGVRLRSVAGDLIAASIRDGQLMLGDSTTVIATDLQVGDVTIHQIDSVLPAPPPKATTRGVRSSRNTAAITKLDLRESAMAVYAAAVARGVPLFNAGNAGACTAVYEMAVDSLVLLGGRDLGEEVFEGLLIAKRNAMREPSTRQRAWLLRAALDEFAVSLNKANAPAPRVTQRR